MLSKTNSLWSNPRRRPHRTWDQTHWGGGCFPRSTGSLRTGGNHFYSKNFWVLFLTCVEPFPIVGLVVKIEEVKLGLSCHQYLCLFTFSPPRCLLGSGFLRSTNAQAFLSLPIFLPIHIQPSGEEVWPNFFATRSLCFTLFCHHLLALWIIHSANLISKVFYHCHSPKDH